MWSCSEKIRKNLADPELFPVALPSFEFDPETMTLGNKANNFSAVQCSYALPEVAKKLAPLLIGQEHLLEDLKKPSYYNRIVALKVIFGFRRTDQEIFLLIAQVIKHNKSLDFDTVTARFGNQLIPTTLDQKFRDELLKFILENVLTQWSADGKPYAFIRECVKRIRKTWKRSSTAVARIPAPEQEEGDIAQTVADFARHDGNYPIDISIYNNVVLKDAIRRTLRMLDKPLLSIGYLNSLDKFDEIIQKHGRGPQTTLTEIDKHLSLDHDLPHISWKILHSLRKLSASSDLSDKTTLANDFASDILLVIPEAEFNGRKDHYLANAIRLLLFCMSSDDACLESTP